MANIQANYPGKIEFPTATEGPFEGIIYGAPMTVSIDYDGSKVPSTGLYEYMTYEGSAGSISMNIAGVQFLSNGDNSGSMGWPLIQFKQGGFSGISYYSKYTVNGVTYVFSVNGLSWNIINAATQQVMASGKIVAQVGAGY